jgi:hypothetical protein
MTSPWLMRASFTSIIFPGASQSSPRACDSIAIFIIV